MTLIHLVEENVLHELDTEIRHNSDFNCFSVVVFICHLVFDNTTFL